MGRESSGGGPDGMSPLQSGRLQPIDLDSATAMAFDFYEWSARFFTNWFTARHGNKVGEDAVGNVYYTEKRSPAGRRPKRWVIYKGASDASMVPPEWHAWLHHTTDTIPAKENPLRRSWQKPHVPNMTGTTEAYRPPGSLAVGGNRAPATGDYEPWVPE